ncbi:MAG: alpha/beta hydrolase family protein [Dehalococcoidia bacterium]
MLTKIASAWRKLSPLRGALPLVAALALAALLPVACGDSQGKGPSATATPTIALEALAERGPFGVGVTTLTLVDESRPTDANGTYPGADSRTLVTEVWYPAEADPQSGEVRNASLDRSQAPYPLVVFSHGFSSIRRQSASFTAHLASHGYIVISPDYPLSNGAAPGGPRLGDVVNQPGDVTFLIDSFLRFSDEPGNQFEGAIDDEAIGLTGHSLGGLTTILATFGSLADSRVKAAVPLAAPACLVGNQNYKDFDTPLLVMGGTEDLIVPFDSVRQAYDAANPPKYLLTLLGGNHMWFADIDLEDSALGSLAAASGPTFLEDALRVARATGANVTACSLPGDGAEPSAQRLAPDRQRELTRLFATAFFNHYLKGDEAASRALTSDFAQTFPELQLQTVQPSAE